VSVPLASLALSFDEGYPKVSVDGPPAVMSRSGLCFVKVGFV
jgi:hypothetical protein